MCISRLLSIKRFQVYHWLILCTANVHYNNIYVYYVLLYIYDPSNSYAKPFCDNTIIYPCAHLLNTAMQTRLTDCLPNNIIVFRYGEYWITLYIERWSHNDKSANDKIGLFDLPRPNDFYGSTDIHTMLLKLTNRHSNFLQLFKLC